MLIIILQVVAYNRTTSKVDDFLNNEVSVTLSSVVKSEASLKVFCSREPDHLRNVTFCCFQAKGTNVVGAHSLEEMVGKLKRPRRVMILVKVLTFVHCSQTKNLKTY